MHKSRLAGFIIDCRTEDIDGAARFWSRALGYSLRESASSEDMGYRLLDTAADDLHIEVQKVEHPSRVHLDIESDDIDAEVRRLEKLGAMRVAQVKDWWVMEAPTGHRFCVVRASSPDFKQHSKEWP